MRTWLRSDNATFSLRYWLTHENALILSLGATLLLMGRHVYHVYNAGPWGYVAAVGLSVATMQFILRGHERRGYAFAALDMIYNLAFFDLLTPLLRLEFQAEHAPELLLSVAIPVVLACYAHDYARGKHVQPAQQVEQPAVASLAVQVASALPTDEQPDVQPVVEPGATLPAWLQSAAEPVEQRKEFACSQCNWSGATRHALAAHSRKHKPARIRPMAAD